MYRIHAMGLINSPVSPLMYPQVGPGPSCLLRRSSALSWLGAVVIWGEMTELFVVSAFPDVRSCVSIEGVG